MKIVQYIGKKQPLMPGSEIEVWDGPMIKTLGALVDDTVWNLTVAVPENYHFSYIEGDNSLRLAMLPLLQNHWHGWPNLEKMLQKNPSNLTTNWREKLDVVTLLAPVDPPSFRDFYAFEQHVQNARKKRGLEMVPEWYDAPVFYFSNTAGIVGPNAPIRKPKETNELDYELEIAVVIGTEGRDIPVAEADSYIAGFTILNDWSARDIQRHEMKVGLGPAKGKDFATSIGPYLVTPDELADRIIETANGNHYDLTMTAHVNGVEYSRGNAKEMRWTFAELIAQAAKNTVLKPGDLIGSGTVGTGCITEFPDGTYPWLQPGDVVRLEIERLGVLENCVDE